MSTPYIPPKDADFNSWLLNFSNVAVANPSNYGLSGGEVTAITGVQSAFYSAYALAINPATRTSVTVAAKDVARINAESVVRPLAVRISKSAAVTNGDKAAIGVTIPSLVPSPVPPPVTAPAIILESAVIGLLNLAFRDSTAPLVRAKPVGVIGCEVWASVGTVAATDPAQCAFFGMFTKTPLQLPTGPAGGKVVTVFCRWSNRSGVGGVAAVGPWSSPLVTHSL